jgi:DNA-binding GntR family transcriptional regulator
MAQRGGRNPAVYRQIAADLRKRIDSGEWPVDEQMPTYDELKKQYGASKNTIDKALGVLRDLGVAETIHGTGTFVRKPPPSEEGLAARVEKLSERLQAVEQVVAELKAGHHARQ